MDLFSGIGGFSLGLERAGMETVAFCEIEPYCRKVLAKHWPDVPIHEDIKELDGERFRGTIDLVCGGFPCQPFSQAGKRRGSDDDRALWPEMLRVIREVQPTWVIGENVIGLETMGLEDCVSDLEGHGFAVQVFDISACGVGAIHRRHRLWIVAHTTLPGPQGRDSGVMQERPGERSAGEVRPHADAHPDCWGCKGEWITGVYDGTCRHNADGRYFEAIGWPTEPPVCGADDGISRRVDRLRALGNAVVPQIPEIIGRAILGRN